MDSEAFRSFAAAVSLGLLLGLEREWSHRQGAPQAAGSRTFALLALAGVAAACLGPWVVAAACLVAGALLVVGYARSSEADPGTTTEIAALSALLLGALAWSRPVAAIALAVTATALLASKGPLHHFARDVITEVEVEDAIKFLVVAAVVMPLLPNRELGPWGALNPSRIWLFVVALTGIGWVGYAGVKWLGARRGLLIAALAGGFISASATTGALARLGRQEASWRHAMAACLLASVATLVQLGAVVAVANPSLAMRLGPAIGAGLVALLAEVALLVLRAAPGGKAPVVSTRPFALLPALIVAAILTASFLAARWGNATFGAAGATTATALAGLVDVHAPSMAVAQMASRAQLEPRTALVAIAGAMASNAMIKGVMAFGAGGFPFGMRFAALLLPAVAAFAAGLWVSLP